MTSRFVLLAALLALGSGCIDTSGLVFGGEGGSGEGGSGEGGSGAGTAGGGQGGDGQGGSGGEGGSTSSADYAAVVLADGPLGYWPLDSFANEIVTEDATGNGWDAFRDDQGGATVDVRDGQVGSAIALSEQESLFVDGGHPFGFATGTYTLEAWVKVEGTDVGGGLWRCRGQAQDAEGYTTFVGSTNLTHKRYDSMGSVSHDLPVGLVGDFRHVVVVYDGENIRWYLDGQPGTTPEMTTTWASQTAPFELASGGSGTGDALIVDEIAAYDQVLAADRIQAHYQCGAMGQCD